MTDSDALLRAKFAEPAVPADSCAAAERRSRWADMRIVKVIPKASTQILVLIGSALAVSCATKAQVPSDGMAANAQLTPDRQEDSWLEPCTPDSPPLDENLRSMMSNEHLLYQVHGARVFRVPDSTLRESIALLEQRSFVPLSAEQATHLLAGANATLDSRLASDARDAMARAQERESEAQNPFFKDYADRFRAEARIYRTVAAEALRLRGGRTAPYLVRGLVLNEATGGFWVHFEGGELSVAHASLGHKMVTARRRPIVVYLDRNPERICVGVSMAK